MMKKSRHIIMNGSLFSEQFFWILRDYYELFKDKKNKNIHKRIRFFQQKVPKNIQIDYIT